MGQVVGTRHGGGGLYAERVCQILMPQPDEINDLDAAFRRRYERLDSFLAAQDFGLVTVWPMPGLISDQFPIQLEPDLELDLLADDELAAALNSELVRPIGGPGMPLLGPGQGAQAGLRYRYRLAKVVGDSNPQQLEQLQKFNEELGDCRSLVEQVLALLYVDPAAISGRLTIETDWTFHSGGIMFSSATLRPGWWSRQLLVDEQGAAEPVRVWRQLRQRGWLQSHKALALALRRLSYQAGRERTEDELVDILVAAEALYLSDVGFEELGFRMALRAAALCRPEKLEMTRREVFDLMKSAYKVRGAVVHGNTPKPQDMRAKGESVPLAEFVQVIEGVIRDGLQVALDRTASPNGGWPPDWDGMTLPQGSDPALQ